MFGCILPGYPPQSGFQNVGPGKWVLHFQCVLAHHQFVIFLTNPQQPLPPDNGVAIYISKANETTFEFVGSITNEKPSGLFAIPPLLIDNLRPHPLCIGLSLEPMANLVNLEGQDRLQKEFYMTGKAELAKQIGQDLYNYMQSFVQEDPNTKTSYLLVPINVLDKWMQRLLNKIKLDAKFLSG
eukprot:EG_transcript_27622